MSKRIYLFLVVVMFALQAMALSTTDFESNNYIQAWGRLKLVTTPNSGGNKVQLADKNGNAVQLRGWSTHTHSSVAFFDNKNDFEGMKRLGANVVRLTCYIASEKSIDATVWNDQKVWLQNAITWNNELGLYVIVDYHVLNPGNPNDYLIGANDSIVYEKAETFFADISTFVKENNYNHVLYEICNEPNTKSDGNGGEINVTWQDIKEYADVILPIIAENDPNAVVIIGTPSWSFHLEDANRDRFEHETLQIMYTFHFYACSHTTLSNTNGHFSDTILCSIPVFATEWNNTNNTGRGECPASTIADTFLARCNYGQNQRISWTAWSWSEVVDEQGEPRTSSTWKNGTSPDGSDYTVENLSPTGLMIYEELQQNHINYDGLNEVKSTVSATFSIYPNPTKDGNFQVTLPTGETALLTVENLQGQTVYSTTIVNGVAFINAKLTEGIYLVSICMKNSAKTQKLVVK